MNQSTTNQIPREIIIVEGRNDTRRLQEVFGSEIRTIETNGSAISKETLERIRQLSQQHELIILTDPDYQGERIRQKIQQVVPQARHVHLNPQEAQGQKSTQNIGVEYAQASYLRQALLQKLTPVDNPTTDISLSQLVELKLIGHPQAKHRRQIISKAFHLGPLNGRQLQKQLENYGITYQEVIQALKEGSCHE